MDTEKKLLRDIKSLKILTIAAVAAVLITTTLFIVFSIRVEKQKLHCKTVTVTVTDVRYETQLQSAKSGKVNSELVVEINVYGKTERLLGVKRGTYSNILMNYKHTKQKVLVYEYNGKYYMSTDSIKPDTFEAKARGYCALASLFCDFIMITSICLLAMYKNRYKRFVREQELKAKIKPQAVRAPVKRTRPSPAKTDHVKEEPKQVKETQKPVKEEPKPVKEAPKPAKEEYIDDVTFIKKMNHIMNGLWHQYDILIDARIYGWETMKDWADYMAESDLEYVDQITVSDLGGTTIDLSDEYKATKSIKSMKSLDVEMGVLTVAGMSKVINSPVKIVWVNQTKVLRFFTMIDDELTMKKYAETVIRRNFGKPDQMKLGKPASENK